jgi:hypothetical protein
MNSLIPITSQPARIGAPVKTRAASAASPRHSALIALWRAHHTEPVQLLRTREGRNLSRARYRRAEEFMHSLAPEAPGNGPDILYNAGIVAQLALSSHLLDVGFPDTWCARHVGLHVARSLAYANATGFGHDCAEMKRLADVLTPYWKWNPRSLVDAPRPNDGGFSPRDIRALSGALLDHVGQVTGHRQSRRRMM